MPPCCKSFDIFFINHSRNIRMTMKLSVQDRKCREVPIVEILNNFLVFYTVYLRQPTALFINKYEVFKGLNIAIHRWKVSNKQQERSILRIISIFLLGKTDVNWRSLSLYLSRTTRFIIGNGLQIT